MLVTRLNLRRFAKTITAAPTTGIDDLFPEPEQPDLTTPLDEQLNLAPSKLDVPKKHQVSDEATRYPIDFDMELVSLAKHD